MKLHRLDGCAPVPLAHYLKALGVLRLVAEQMDPLARGWWEGERFVLATEADAEQLMRFFLEQYEPTPMINPWGARSGFYPGSSEATSRALLQRIVSSRDARFAHFREVEKTARNVIAGVTGGAKPDDADGDGKTELVLALRASMRASASDWLAAVVAVVDAGGKGLQQPALWGTGGSEGSGSYCAAYMKAIDECLLSRRWDAALPYSLFGDLRRPSGNWAESFGQFLPSGIGNPWDLMLAFEGACLVRSSVVRRSDTVGDRWVSSPFYVAPTGAGAASSARLDEFALNKGKELPGRGEQWFPLWAGPASLSEVSHLFCAGRTLLGRSRPGSALSLARSIARLGSARGIRQFVRYGYLQRNNQATHFAVPLGRFEVPEHAEPKLACLDDLDEWLRRLRREARASGAPARLVATERRLSDALLALTQHADEPASWQLVLQSMAAVEALQVYGTGGKAGPLPRLRPQWAIAADDGSAEHRLALAFALQGIQDPDDRRHDSVRNHWLGTKGQPPRPSTDSNAGRTRCVMQGRRGLDDAIAVVERRLVEGARSGWRHLPLEPGCGIGASLHDLGRVLRGEVDLDRCIALARALMALDRAACERERLRLRIKPAPAGEAPDDAWIAIRLALLPWPLPDGRAPGCDPAIVRRLGSGDLAGAAQIAARRLHVAGIVCPVVAAPGDAALARRYAAALAFPFNPDAAAGLADRLHPTDLKEKTA